MAEIRLRIHSNGNVQLRTNSELVEGSSGFRVGADLNVNEIIENPSLPVPFRIHPNGVLEIKGQLEEGVNL